MKQYLQHPDDRMGMHISKTAMLATPPNLTISQHVVIHSWWTHTNRANPKLAALNTCVDELKESSCRKEICASAVKIKLAIWQNSHDFSSLLLSTRSNAEGSATESEPFQTELTGQSRQKLVIPPDVQQCISLCPRRCVQKCPDTGAARHPANFHSQKFSWQSVLCRLLQTIDQSIFSHSLLTPWDRHKKDLMNNS